MWSAVPISRKRLSKKYLDGPAYLKCNSDGLELNGELISRNGILFVKSDVGASFKRRTKRTYVSRRVCSGDEIGVPDPRWWDRKHASLKHYSVM